MTDYCRPPRTHRFILYIAGTTPQSTRAIVNTRKLCKIHLRGRAELEIVDICKHPAMAAEAQLVATPTLVRRRPLPVRRYAGDVSRIDKILADLGMAVGTNSSAGGEPS